MRPDSDQHQQISADRNQDLRLYGIDRVAKEMLDGQVLLEALPECFERSIGSALCGICRDIPHPLVGLVGIDQMLETTERDKVQQLRKNCIALDWSTSVHDCASAARKTVDDGAYRGSTIPNHWNSPCAGKTRLKRRYPC